MLKGKIIETILCCAKQSYWM